MACRRPCLPLGSCVADQSPSQPTGTSQGGDYCPLRYLPQMPKELTIAGEQVPLENPLVAKSWTARSPSPRMTRPRW